VKGPFYVAKIGEEIACLAATITFIGKPKCFKRPKLAKVHHNSITLFLVVAFE
jgi:hypothetical protein